MSALGLQRETNVRSWVYSLKPMSALGLEIETNVRVGFTGPFSQTPNQTVQLRGHFFSIDEDFSKINIFR